MVLLHQLLKDLVADLFALLLQELRVIVALARCYEVLISLLKSGLLAAGRTSLRNEATI